MMAHRRFESELNLGAIISRTLHGGIRGAAVQEKDATGVYQPTLIIRTDRDWAITVNWALAGTMLDGPPFTTPGNWVVKAYLEGLGQNAEEKYINSDSGEIQVGSPTSRVAGVPGVSDPEWQYQDTLTVLKTDNPKAGPYRLTIIITYKDAAGNPGSMAGFLEAGIVQLYDPSQPEFSQTQNIELADLQNAATRQSQTLAARRSLDIGTTITLETAGGRPISLSQEILSPNYLADTVVPCLNAIAEIQYIIDELRGRKFQPIKIKSIRQSSPISVSLDGASEAIQLVQDAIVPWKRRHAEAMAHLSEQEKQAEIESRRAEVLEKRARAAKDRAEAEKLTAETSKQNEEAEKMKLENERLRLELRRAKIQLALDMLNQIAPNLPETEKIAYVVKLLPPLDTLIFSSLEITGL